jgi:hypothetical protein
MVDDGMHIQAEKEPTFLGDRIFPRFHHLARHSARRADLADPASFDDIAA